MKTSLALILSTVALLTAPACKKKNQDVPVTSPKEGVAGSGPIGDLPSMLNRSAVRVKSGLASPARSTKSAIEEQAAKCSGAGR